MAALLSAKQTPMHVDYDTCYRLVPLLLLLLLLCTRCALIVLLLILCVVVPSMVAALSTKQTPMFIDCTVVGVSLQK